MSGFDSLMIALEGWFDKPLCDLPDKLRQRVKQDFSPMPWDELSPDQRRNVAYQWDYQHNPATEEEREYWWDFFIRMDDLKQQIEEWKAVSAPTANDLKQKETRLQELTKGLVLMENQQLCAERKGVQGVTACSLPTGYIAYPRALKHLVVRLEAAPEELAAWVWQGSEDGGLAAYLNANELVPPPMFNYGHIMGEDYLSPLMACWFKEDEITNFQPVDRYLTGKALIERWSEQPGIQVEAFIVAKIAESRLMDYHPIFGGTRGSNPNDESFPALESGLFVLADVEAIEYDDFGLEHNNLSGKNENKKKESPAERKKRLKTWVQEECRVRGESGALKRTAKREGITRQTLSGILYRSD